MTLRELLIMDEARSRDAWDHTAQLLATLINVNRAKGDPVHPKQCHPYYRTDDRPIKLSKEQSRKVLEQWTAARGYTSG